MKLMLSSKVQRQWGLLIGSLMPILAKSKRLCRVRRRAFPRRTLVAIANSRTIPATSYTCVLSPELVRLRYLQHVDLAYNYLSGSIPIQWVSTQMNFVSLLGNRLSGSIPKELGNFSSLKYLSLEANQFSGTVPPELGKLVNLETLVLSSNNLSGNLPKELGGLKNLTDFRINDNNLNGTIPDFIQNWKNLERLEMIASGLEGPIPSSISVLEKLEDLRITDISTGTIQAFPELTNMTGLTRIVMRNCNISGEIPDYIWGMNSLLTLDLSFNKLSGELPSVISTETLKFIFLSGNSLSGDVPESILKKGTNVDLSYNNFTWQSEEKPACQTKDLNLNLFQSSPKENGLRAFRPCMKDFKCSQYSHSLYINCGGDDVQEGDIVYQGDANVDGGAATFFSSENGHWGLSSTGDFMDDNDFQNTRYVATLTSPNISALYSEARLSPLSLTYYQYCLQNGSYTVSLHFVEIQFTNDKTYNSLGRRIFDIYIQDKLVEEDFNITAEAYEVVTPVTKKYNASVEQGILEIRFYWAGKGTTRIPEIGIYGPLISAISVDPNFVPPSEGGKTRIAPIIIGAVGSCLIFLALCVLWWRCYFRAKSGREQDIKGLELQTSSFSLKQINIATNNFDPANKIGEGGFGPVYKGLLADGTVIAVKQLSSKSRQGNREFLNEIGMISCLQHPNLVKLYGCCIEGDQLLLVYEYLENNSLARALFGPEKFQLKLDWPTRHKICVGIAQGLAFLHEESRLKIVHRDIKGTNVLLDRELNPKISDFGLARLDEGEKTHISTRIAGTIGYMAPEYALWGYLTYKADVYSFGVVALEIVSGKHNMSYGPASNCACLLDWACHLQETGSLMELVDQKLGSEFNKVEAERMMKVAFLCTNASPSLRPTMSEVVNMLEGTTVIPDVIPEASTYSKDLRFKAIRDHHSQMRSQSMEGSQDHRSTSVGSLHGSSSASAHDLYEITDESYLRFKAMRDNYMQMESKTSEASHAQNSTSVSSGIGPSSTSEDLHEINLKNPSIF
ncbi:probable LRR receptor-like serine/threonine-protein kinase RFK1 isoform X5 [Juglans microcarpa x Juglans regia]|uniref:probable LRR receptor-like serine/threonine-protein kinase RFK1 isoform X5 n=1 Tax=Juglans microcarpa x Juglans regia TaxID=2249226 RepID=UPI001B7EB864|nr:probable LRR receptor-like serine/threonine-protein kinase RFK1 isoform X5 [Juglans microcarpa x Juglans regia]